MFASCPLKTCAFRRSKGNVVRDGHFYRQSEARWIQRFKCRSCGKKFSHATGTMEFGQKKRRVNSRLRDLLCSGISMRRSARVLRINRITVERKLAYLARKARSSQKDFLRTQVVSHLQFDDLITIEHTKMKPLTVSLAVDAKTRVILGAEVGRIPAFGLLAEKSRQKYGRRRCQHDKTLNRLFEKVAPVVAANALVESDEHPRYPKFVTRFLPNRQHVRYPGGRGAIAGQGELKKLIYDPLFKLNHSCAMLRANINRLIRKTWCTTKSPWHLQQHLDIFVDFHNRIYLAGQ